MRKTTILFTALGLVAGATLAAISMGRSLGDWADLTLSLLLFYVAILIAVGGLRRRKHSTQALIIGFWVLGSLTFTLLTGNPIFFLGMLVIVLCAGLTASFLDKADQGSAHATLRKHAGADRGGW